MQSCLISLCLCLLLAVPTVVAAQKEPQVGADSPSASSALLRPATPPASQHAPTRIRVKRDRSGRKTYVLEDPIVLFGRDPRPKAFYVLQRTRVDFQGKRPSCSLTPRILEAVRRHPF